MPSRFVSPPTIRLARVERRQSDPAASLPAMVDLNSPCYYDFLEIFINNNNNNLDLR